MCPVNVNMSLRVWFRQRYKDSKKEVHCQTFPLCPDSCCPNLKTLSARLVPQPSDCDLTQTLLPPKNTQISPCWWVVSTNANLQSLAKCISHDHTSSKCQRAAADAVGNQNSLTVVSYHNTVHYADWVESTVRGHSNDMRPEDKQYPIL